MEESFFSEHKDMIMLRDIFNKYKSISSDYITKYEVIKMFYDYTLLDTCGINIFDLNNLLYDLEAELEEGQEKTCPDLSLEKFLRLLFFIHRRQYEDADAQSDLSTVTVDSITKMMNPKGKREYNFKDRSIIYMMIKQGLEKEDRHRYKDKKGREKEDEDEETRQIFYYLMKPNVKSEDVHMLITPYNLKIIERYQNNIYDRLFRPYASKKKENFDKDFPSINVTELNRFLYDKNFMANFSSGEMGDILINYFDLKLKSDDDKKYFNKLFEDKKKEKEIKDIFNRFIIPKSEINFNYSLFVLILGNFAKCLKSTEGEIFERQVEFFFEKVLEIKPDDNGENMKLDDNKDKDNDIIYEYLPEPPRLTNAKKRLPKTADDEEFISDFLNTLNDILPDPDEKVLEFMNEEEYHADTYSFYKAKREHPVAKFPVEELMVEREEALARQTAEKEKKAIAKAAKPKKKQKEKRENPCDCPLEPITTIEEHNLKYFGKPRIESLTHRLLKHTIKEILPNSNVYPSVIKEILMIPRKINDKALEIIVESFKDQVAGHIEQSIKRLEKSKDYLNKDLQTDGQIELFYVLNLGSLYESLDFDMEALTYYSEALELRKKFISVDPDNALVFCFLGEIFIKLKEYIWALRCYLMAKKIREETIGGDTPDTAAVYNNLGVVCYLMKSFLPANGYFKLSYEIYREFCGINHPRTMMIKSNLSKMNQLDFNKSVQFKTLSLVPLPAIMCRNPKKKKK
ncbi:MAG: tetratricopeptide repeat protein [archaeon]|nr:tetratricopeptide repeat protein [archaeon]